MTSSAIILGANAESVPLIVSALRNFDNVYVADPYPESIGKTIEGVRPLDVNPVDTDAVLQLCSKHQIESVLLGVADRLVYPYAKLCAQLNKQSCYSVNAAKILSNKILFNQTILSYGIFGIPNLNDIDARDHLQKENWVVVKPADGNSSKGLTIVHEPYQLNDAIIHAKNHSASKTTLIEPFMHEPGIGIYLTFYQGECINSTIYDRIESKSHMGDNNLPVGSLYPSKYTDIYSKKVHSKLVELLKEVGFSNGPIMFSAYVCDDNIYVYDPGARLQGEGADVGVQYLHGIDQKQLMINISKSNTSVNNSIPFSNSQTELPIIASIWIYLGSGRIGAINGLDTIQQKKWFHELRPRLNVGDFVTENMLNTEGSVFCRVYVKMRNRCEFKEIAQDLHSIISVNDEHGVEMIRDVSQIYADVN